jgi:3-isopropylmalate/(R)-2-methylmalate dehydratase small subunit
MMASASQDSLPQTSITPEGLTTVTARMVPFFRNDVDTDQIIPARFLKGTEKTGLGQFLFYDWRYLTAGETITNQTVTLDPQFVLNQPRFAGAQVLVAGHNFGCGSSREHAPWALKDYGFQVVLAVSFADIFKNNALKNQVLPIPLPETTIMALTQLAESDPSAQITVDIPTQQVHLPKALHAGHGDRLPFALDPFRKTCLLQGVDEIGYSLNLLPSIEAFEAAH